MLEDCAAGREREVEVAEIAGEVCRERLGHPVKDRRPGAGPVPSRCCAGTSVVKELDRGQRFAVARTQPQGTDGRRHHEAAGSVGHQLSTTTGAPRPRARTGSTMVAASPTRTIVHAPST